MTLEDLINRKDAYNLIADVMGFAYTYVRDTVSKRSDFPAPVREIGRNALYNRRDIEKWLGVK